MQTKPNAKYYDPAWASSYGLERMICAMDKANCKTYIPVDKSKWPELLSNSEQYIFDYYFTTPLKLIDELK